MELLLSYNINYKPSRYHILSYYMMNVADRNRDLERRCGSGEQLSEMDPVQPILRRNTAVGREFRPSESDSNGGCKGVDVVAQLERNGYCSRSSSDQSVKRSTSDQSVQRSCETLQTRTSSHSAGSRPRSKSRPASKQRTNFLTQTSDVFRAGDIGLKKAQWVLYIIDRQLDVEEAMIRLERNRLFNDASSSCSGHASTLSDREASTEEEVKKLKRQMKLVVDQKAYLEEILRLKEVKCSDLTQQLLQWDEQTEREKIQTDGVIVELQHQLQALQDRNRDLERRCGSGEQLSEMDPVQPILRRNTAVGREFRPSESDSNGGCKGVDVVAQLERNGYCSRSSSDQSVKRSTSDQSVQRSCETLQTRTSSHSAGSRPRSKSRPASKQKIAVAVEDILPSEKERLMFNHHKTMKEESFISFGETGES
eukprot:sb/3464983/